jgi:O-acetylhomoserine (thiol)-lyase
MRSEDERDAAGIGPGTLRVSIGIEHLPDLLRDLEHGVEAARGSAAA